MRLWLNNKMKLFLIRGFVVHLIEGWKNKTVIGATVNDY
jgi:hypothetical protein